MGKESPQFGVVLPTRGLLLGGEGPRDGELVLAMAEAAEGYGLNSVWVGDSLTAKPRLEPLTTLAAVAARTRNVRLGTSVLLASLRHPVLLAHTAATLDLISGGRLVLAMGVGGAFTEEQKREWLAAGVSPSQRAGRLEEIVAIMRGLWAHGPFSFHGHYFNLDEVALEPKPIQRPGIPIWLACHGRAHLEAQYHRAALLGDGYISITDTPAEYAEAGRGVKASAVEAGRDPEALASAFYMTVNLNTDERKAAEEANIFLLQYYGFNHWGDRWGPFGHPKRVVSRIQEYVDAGAKVVILRFASFRPLEQLEYCVKEVLPAFRRG